ncbi:hypothetical protein CCACVL1_23180 [Corchorus capsularis]|uniref:Uncharacterized protein n=1 Tax=Corchorus capsularis TaxID=210143 RepID=A0A1R3GV08_COCAP|nr:hypothetical protein CCACVL1_23180 [Corchorus capsularis]
MAATSTTILIHKIYVLITSKAKSSAVFYMPRTIGC